MDKTVKPTPAGSYPLGHAKENKDASAYTGFKYPSGGGDDIGVYKQPMSLTTENTTTGPLLTDTLKMSIGNVSKGMLGAVNPHGVKEMRGYGAATKGRKISGKQG